MARRPKSTAQPQVVDGPIPLDQAAQRALRFFGDGAPDLADASLMLMFVDFANEIVELVRHHPYWPKDEPLDYYVALQDRRPIPDLALVNGLTAYYALQQGSQKAGILMSRFHLTMNQTLWNRLSGSARPMLRPMDGGTWPDRFGAKANVK